MTDEELAEAIEALFSSLEEPSPRYDPDYPRGAPSDRPWLRPEHGVPDRLEMLRDTYQNFDPYPYDEDLNSDSIVGFDFLGGNVGGSDAEGGHLERYGHAQDPSGRPYQLSAPLRPNREGVETHFAPEGFEGISPHDPTRRRRDITTPEMLARHQARQDEWDEGSLPAEDYYGGLGLNDIPSGYIRTGEDSPLGSNELINIQNHYGPVTSGEQWLDSPEVIQYMADNPSANLANSYEAWDWDAIDRPNDGRGALHQEALQMLRDPETPEPLREAIRVALPALLGAETDRDVFRGTGLVQSTGELIDDIFDPTENVMSGFRGSQEPLDPLDSNLFDPLLAQIEDTSEFDPLVRRPAGHLEGGVNPDDVVTEAYFNEETGEWVQPAETRHDTYKSPSDADFFFTRLLNFLDEYAAENTREDPVNAGPRDLEGPIDIPELKPWDPKKMPKGGGGGGW